MSERCPECGFEGEPRGRAAGGEHRFGSSPGCWAAYGEVLRREYESPELMKAHSLTVDAYAVQHVGPQPARSVAAHLLSLRAVFVEGAAVEDGARRMRAFAEDPRDYPALEPPADRGLTVAHALPAKTPEQHRTLVREWAQSAWEAWAPRHEEIAALAR